MKETMNPLSKKLFDFARAADEINAELNKLCTPAKLTEEDRSLIAAQRDLQPFLSLMARKAERLASCLNVAEQEKSA